MNIGDQRSVGDTSPAGDQRKAGDTGPAGDPRGTGEATTKTTTKPKNKTKQPINPDTHTEGTRGD